MRGHQFIAVNPKLELGRSADICFEEIYKHNIAKYVLATQVPGSRPRGRPKLRWMDRIKQDMKENNIRPECATDRESWFILIRNVNPTT